MRVAVPLFSVLVVALGCGSAPDLPPLPDQNGPGPGVTVETMTTDRDITTVAVPAGTAPAAGGVCALPSKTGPGGVTLWTWKIHWSPQQGKTLDELCAKYGSDAVMEVSIDVLDGGSVNPPRVIEGRCSSREIVVDLPSQYVFHGSRRIVGKPNGRASSAQIITNDVHCPRDVSFIVWDQ